MKEEVLSLTPGELGTRKLHGVLLGAVGPRPIAFASTLDARGRPNLAPFSFFNVFGSNPPVLIFSPARRVRDNTAKHTLENAQLSREVVINAVSHAMVQQMSLASSEYPQGVNEFVKAGFTMLPSHLVKPFRVGESPAQFECKVTQVVPLGQGGGAGNLIFCEVLKIHLRRDALDDQGLPDPYKMDLVARMGGNWYSRASEGLFEVPKPLSTPGIGVDAIPEAIRSSRILTGNDLGMLGTIEELPDQVAIAEFVTGRMEVRKILSSRDTDAIHTKAQAFLEQNDVSSAWKILLAAYS